MQKIRSKPPQQTLTDTVYVNTPCNTVEESFVMYSRTPQGFFAVHKEWVKLFGIISAMILANYVEKHKYFKDHCPQNDGWFFLRYEDIAAELGISEHIIRKSKQQLIDSKVLEIRIFGLPKTEWLRIDFKSLSTLDTNGCSRTKDNSGKDLKNFKVWTLNSLRSNINSINPIYIKKNKEIIRIKREKKIDKKSFENSNQPEMNIIPLTKQLISVDLFDKFWKLYPRKVNKPGAEKSFQKLCNQKDRPTWGTIKAALLNQILSEQWQSAQFIPHPTTWLNQHRWDEVLPESKTTTKTNFFLNENPESDPIKPHDCEI